MKEYSNEMAIIEDEKDVNQKKTVPELSLYILSCILSEENKMDGLYIHRSSYGRKPRNKLNIEL